MNELAKKIGLRMYGTVIVVVFLTYHYTIEPVIRAYRFVRCLIIGHEYVHYEKNKFVPERTMCKHCGKKKS